MLKKEIDKWEKNASINNKNNYIINKNQFLK